MAILEEAPFQKRLTGKKEAYREVKALGLETEDEATALVREDRDAR